MSRQLPFDIEVAAGRVSGILRAPGDAENAPPAPVLLICSALPGSALRHGDFVEAVAVRVLARGIGVAQFEPRSGDDAARDDVKTVIDDAAAVFRWLLLNDAVDPHAIGVLGVGLGGLVAAGLVARTNQVGRLRLVAPAMNDDAVARIAKANGAEPLLAPDAAEAANAAWIASLEALTPTRDIAVHDRPTLIVQGAADRVVNSVMPFVQAVERSGHHVEYERIARADHGFTAPKLREVCLARIQRFLDDLRAPSGNGKKG